MAQKDPEIEGKIHRYQAETEEKRRELAGLKEEADRLRDEAQKMKELREAKVEQVKNEIIAQQTVTVHSLETSRNNQSVCTYILLYG